MHAWPPMTSVLAPLFWIEERALSIGLWIKRSSQGEICLPHLRRFKKPLGRGQRIPCRPLISGDVFRAKTFHDSYCSRFVHKSRHVTGYTLRKGVRHAQARAISAV